MITVAIIGDGALGRVHRERLEQLSGVTPITAPTPHSDDPTTRAVDSAARRQVTEHFLSKTNADVVDLCTPLKERIAYTEAAVTKGVDVICPAPLADTVRSARTLGSLVDGSATTIYPCHPYRFSPEYATLRSEIASGEIGSPGVVRATRLFPGEDRAADADWAADRRLAPSLFSSLAFHDFDFCRWGVGTVERVFARTSSLEEGTHATATLRFESGAVGHVECLDESIEPLPYTREVEVAGDDGVLSYDSPHDKSYQRYTDSDERRGTEVDLLAVDGDGRDGYHRALTDIVAAIDRGEETTISPKDSIASLQVAEAAERSARIGEPVRPVEVDE